MPRAANSRTAVRRFMIDGSVPSTHDVAYVTNDGYDTARRGLRRVGVHMRTQEEVLLLKYRAAVLLAQVAHPQKIATFEGIARVRKVRLGTVHKFFSDPKREELCEKWGVVCEKEVTRIILERAARRWRKKNPGKILTRKRLAYESKLSYACVSERLHAHPDLCQEIGVVYTYSGYEKTDSAHLKSKETLWRSKNPGVALTRKKFACALNWEYDRLVSVLRRHPRLLDELGIVGRVTRRRKKLQLPCT